MPQALEERVSFLEGRVGGIEDAVRRLETGLERVETRVDHLEITFNQRITALEEKMDRRFELMETQIHRISITIGVGFSILVALITLFKFL